MCASVCPSQALFYGTREEIERLRPRSKPVNAFQFGQQTITTRVHMMVPGDESINLVDVASSLYQPPAPQTSSGVQATDLFTNLYQSETP